MNSLPSQAILGGLVAVFAVAIAATLGSAPFAVALVSAALACVAFVAQSRRLRDEQRLVYRPVYVRRQSVQRRVRSDD